MATLTHTPITRPQRVFVMAALGAAATWAALILAFGGLHFDDFVNIAESAGALAPSGWGDLAADGRWQPMKRATYDLIARIAGLRFWPYAVALMGAHAAMAGGVAACASAIWRDRAITLTAGLVALASLNLSAFSVAYAATLHGIASAALSVWCVALSLRAEAGGNGRMRWRIPAAAMVMAACLYKETAVMTPAFALFVAWLVRRNRHLTPGDVARVIGPAIAGVLAYLLLRVVTDVPLLPPQGRYSGGSTFRPLLHAAVVLAHVLPWSAAAAWNGFVARGRVRRDAVATIAAAAAAAIAVVLPTLVLSWQSPNFFYAAAPVAALGAAAASRSSTSPRIAYGALTAVVILALAGSITVAARRGVHKWGPYAESSVAAWQAMGHAGGRVIWFDANSHERYGGLARTIGPGDRLTYALRLASGNPSLEAVACIAVLVGPPCVPQPGDELYLHSAGHVQRIDTPPTGAWYIMP